MQGVTPSDWEFEIVDKIKHNEEIAQDIEHGIVKEPCRLYI